MEDFIAIGRDVNESDGDGRTALHYAVAYDHADIVTELVANGADLDAQVCTTGISHDLKTAQRLCCCQYCADDEWQNLGVARHLYHAIPYLRQ